mmetsp:Transcript_26363/g.43798  ORF Transcript_26363/g.43798 Transcript_26363/m.43798 type:complete len:256 (+) Transcript_26363:99-866(+)
MLLVLGYAASTSNGLSGSPAHVSPTSSGTAQANLLVALADWVARGAHGCITPSAGLAMLQVTANRTALLGFRTGWQSVAFHGTDPVVTGSVGTVPGVIDATTAQFVKLAARWIHADVTWNFTEQRAILAENARCFGISGREAIIASSEGLFASTAWAIPYAITLDIENAMVSFDFDVIDRQADKIIGRGTDLVHFASVNEGVVTKIDTFRHVWEQPEWVQEQVCNATETAGSAENDRVQSLGVPPAEGSLAPRAT